MRRQEVMDWLSVDAEKTKPAVVGTLTAAMFSRLNVLDRSGQRLISQLQQRQQEVLQILDHMQNVKSSTH